MRWDLTGERIRVGTGWHFQRIADVRSHEVVYGAEVVLSAFESRFANLVAGLDFDFGIPETAGESIDA